MSKARRSFESKCIEFGQTVAKTVYDQLVEEREYGDNETVDSIAKRAVGKALIENSQGNDVVFSQATQGLLAEIDRETLNG